MKRKLYVGVEIYVGQLSGTVTENEVRNLFSVVGTVTSVHLVIDPGSGAFRGCGYVRMSTKDEAREAVNFLNGALLGDRLIVVKEAPPKKSTKAGSSGARRGVKGGRTGPGGTKTSG
jgi:RNA recognition motif-containing protein